MNRLSAVTGHLSRAEAKANHAMQHSLSTHVLNTATGQTGSTMSVTLESQDGSSWKSVGTWVTNADGRVRDFPKLSAGTHRLIFDTMSYFKSLSQECFYPCVKVEFALPVSDAPQHYHVPLLVSPFGFSTYRGS